MTNRETKMSAERLDEMKSAINSFLSQANVYDSIRDIVDTYVTENEGSAMPTDPNEIMKVVREKGILKDLLSQMKNTSISQAAKPKDLLLPVPGQTYLHVRLNGGRAFVDFVDHSCSAQAHKLFVAIHFGSERFQSSLRPCTTDPKFDDDFLFELDASPYGYARNDFIEINTPFHIAVFHENMKAATSLLVGENSIDWRKVLKTGFLGLTVELCGANAGVPAGILEIQLEIVPRPRQLPLTSEEEIEKRIESQRSVVTTCDREFLVYSRRWWSEYQGARSTHKERKVKLFTSISNGRMVPVTHFISPLQAEYGLDSPTEAARFVSLLGVCNSQDVSLQPLCTGEGRTWLPPFVFLSQRQGHSCNHAALLCSLLLGFGLNAFCAIGTGAEGNVVTFVMTFGGSAIIWVPITGDRISVKTAHEFRTVDCLFNNKAFYANVQNSNDVSTTLFDVTNEELWKPINPLKLRLVPRHPSAPLLCQSVSGHVIERKLEMDLRRLLTTLRDAFGAMTSFNDDLSYTLSQALVGYERERTGEASPDTATFQQCVKGFLGPGMTFKAIPVNLPQQDAAVIMGEITESASGKEIIETVGENVTFGLRVKVFTFPERVVSVWVLLAVAYSVRTLS